jgi:hypothetical protein
VSSFMNHRQVVSQRGTLRARAGQVESLWLAKDPDGRVREALAVTTSHAATRTAGDSRLLAAPAISERHMPSATRKALLEIRSLLRSPDWDEVRAGIDRALAQAETQRVLTCGMLLRRGGTSMQATARSEIVRRVRFEHQRRASEAMGMLVRPSIDGRRA